MRRVAAFSPGHVTGFFKISEHSTDDPMLKGSTGAGFSITGGCTTTVTTSDTEQSNTEYYINGQLRPDAKVSQTVVRLFSEKGFSISRQISRIDHELNIPQGCGLGTSGAGALSLALALNEAAGCPLTKIEAAAVAHCAEVYCGTGLGTVISEFTGGFEIRTEPGAPGIGKIERFGFPEDLRAYFIIFGSINTSTFLKNPEIRNKVNLYGPEYINNLRKKPDWKNFLAFSAAFSKDTGFMDDKLLSVTKSLEQNGFKSAMLMFGRGIFTLADVSQKSIISDILHEYSDGIIFDTGIARTGGNVIHVS